MRSEYIRSFIGVVRHKSFSMAAKYLYLSQPTISTHIKQLESELGVQLLVRSTKDVLLSEEGKIFYPYALQLLEIENQAWNQLNKNEGNSDSVVSIAVSSVPGYYVLPSFLSNIRGKYPSVTFNIIEGDSGNVIQKLLDFEAEIGVGSVPGDSEKIYSEILFEDEIVLLTPNTEKYRNMKGKFPKELFKSESFIVREFGSGTKTMTENMEKELKLDVASFSVAARFESSEMVRRAVEAGLGVAFISKTAAKESLEQERAVAFTFPDIHTKRQLYLMIHRERILSKAAEATLWALKKYCKEKQ